MLQVCWDLLHTTTRKMYTNRKKENISKTAVKHIVIQLQYRLRVNELLLR